MTIRSAFRQTALACALCAMLPAAFAQETFEWTLKGDIGVGAFGKNTNVVGRDNTLSILPFGYADYGRAFWRVDTVGVKTLQMGYGYLEIVGRFDFENSTNTKSDFSSLFKRENAIPLGLGTFQKTPWGGFFLHGYQDVGASRGQVAEARYAAKFDVQKLSIYPQVAVEYRSAKFNDTYYGTPTYHAGASVNPTVAVAAEYPLYENWMLNAQVRRKWLGSQVADSPLVNRRTLDDAYLAVSYKFK